MLCGTADLQRTNVYLRNTAVAPFWTSNPLWQSPWEYYPVNPPHWGFSHVRRSLAVLTQSFKQDVPVQMGIEAPLMFTEKSPQWDSYLLINKWFMWSTPNKIGTKDVRTAPLTSQPRISERLWECTTAPKAFCSRNLIAQSTDLFLWVLQHNDSVRTWN